MEKIYRVKLNSKGMPNFATAEEVADRPQGEWELVGERTQYRRCPYCKRTRAFQDTRFCDWCGARMKGADDE